MVQQDFYSDMTTESEQHVRDYIWLVTPPNSKSDPSSLGSISPASSQASDATIPNETQRDSSRSEFDDIQEFQVLLLNVLKYF